ncbi:hypothetical protein GCM10011282_15140 [Undibacterium macrobrachii]|jgi:hypothetical protein|uniref:Tetratricopeptide repeat protein n=2 Tax=Undibacterium macrobrachii TaxID=1119058 RepID=A0ABQ2XC04_9BURK|nr:hypothetical protein GCM10011282_15140 [Undibacterium macrobrachii]
MRGQSGSISSPQDDNLVETASYTYKVLLGLSYSFAHYTKAMIKKSPIALAALILALGTASVSVLPVTAQAQTAEEKAKKEVIRSEWSKPYTEIQKLIGEKQYQAALEKVAALDASDKKTDYEVFFLHRTRAAIASGMGDNVALAKSFDAMIGSEFLPPADKLRFMEGMAGTFYNLKQYAESQVWTKRYLAANPSNTMMQDLMVQNYYLADDFTNALKEVKAQVASDEQAGKVPDEKRLRLLHGSAMKLKDIDSSTQALELLVKYHPTKEYWADLMYRLISKQGFSDRLRLDWYRLMLANENLEDDTQYMEMAEIALLAGLPLEAKNIVDAAYKAGYFGKGKNAAKHKPLQDKANKQAADDAKTLDAGEAAAKATKTGLAMTNMGYNFVTYGQYERGIALIEAGLAKGGLKYPEEAKLHLGIAYHKAGNKAKAAEVLKTVQGNDGAVELARYWTYMK